MLLTHSVKLPQIGNKIVVQINRTCHKHELMQGTSMLWSQFCSWENTLQILRMQMRLRIKRDMNDSKTKGTWRDVRLEEFFKSRKKTRHGYEDLGREKENHDFFIWYPKISNEKIHKKDDNDSFLEENLRFKWRNNNKNKIAHIDSSFFLEKSKNNATKNL